MRNTCTPCRSSIKVEKKRHRSTSLKVLAFSDCRSQDIDSLLKGIGELPKPDLILYGGDDTHRFRAGDRNLFEEIAALSRYGLCAVRGNDDEVESRHITGRRVYDVHTTALDLGPFAVVGIESAPLFPPGVGERLNIGHGLYTERLIQHQIQTWQCLAQKKLIIVSHAPPYEVLDSALRFGKRHIGSRPLRDFLLSSADALLCVCGHVHFCGGRDARLGASTVLNCASHDGERDPLKMAFIEIVDGDVAQVEWKLIPNIDPRQSELF